MREELPAPPRIADYELLRPIGRGSYGVVWLARSVTGLYRAVKIVWRESFEDPQPYEREFRGIKEFAAISLVAPRQLALLHVGRNDAEGFFYYVMELADDVETGREIAPTSYVPNTLKEVRARRHRLPAAEAIALAVELAEGLAELHQRGLVHRDIKPSNIILVGGAPKLADIGLVASTRNSELTMSRVGNPGYMPPDFPGVPSADVFGLGRVLYELAMGRERDDFPALPDLADFDDRKELLELNEVLLRACAPDPARRYADAGALLDDLRLLQAGKSVRRLRAAERHLSRALRSVAVLAVAAIMAGTGAWIAQKQAAREMALRANAEKERDVIASKSVYSATLTRAQRALETNELGLARRHLRKLIPLRSEPDLRGFEWHALWNEAQGDHAIVAETAGEMIKQIALSPDQLLIAGQVGDTHIEIWDAATLRKVHTIAGTRMVGGFSADGKWLFGTDQRGGLQRWRFATGEPGGVPSAGQNYPAVPIGSNRLVALLRDGRETAVAIRVWNFDRNADDVAIAPLVPNPEKTLFMTYPTVTPDGKRCAVTLLDQSPIPAVWRIQVYDLGDSRLVHEHVTSSRVTALALSPDGKWLAAAQADRGTLVVRDVTSDTVRWQQPAGMSVVQTIAFSPVGHHLAVGGRSGSVHVLDTRDGSLVRSFVGQERDTVAVQWIGEKTLVSGGSGGDLRRWDLNGPKRDSMRPRVSNQGLISQAICVSNDGSLFATAASNQIRVARIRPGAGTDLAIDAQFPLAFGPQSDRLFALTTSGVFMEVALDPAPKVLRQDAWLEPGITLKCASMSANGKVVAAATLGGDIWFWNADTREPIGTRRIAQPFMWVTLSANGDAAVTNGRDNVVRLWSTARVEPRREFGNNLRRAFSGTFSPDGRQFALAMDRGEVEIRSSQTGDVITRIMTDSESIYDVAFSPDATRLYCGGSKGAVHIYATDDWRLIVTFSVSPSTDDRDAQILGLAATRQSDALLAYRADGLMRFWTSDLLRPPQPQPVSR